MPAEAALRSWNRLDWITGRSPGFPGAMWCYRGCRAFPDLNVIA